MRHARPAIAAIAALLAVALTSLVTPAARGEPGMRYEVLPLRTEVRVSALPRPEPAPPRRIEDESEQESPPDLGDATPRRTGVVTFGGRDGPRAQETPLEVLSSFDGMNRARQINLLGTQQAVAPPDTQIAAGPANLVQMVNVSGSVWTKEGQLVSSFDLAQFFGIRAGTGPSDPRVFYDDATGRWFASIFAFDDLDNSDVYVAVSATADPRGTWKVYTVASNVTGTLYDQPKIGIARDKLGISWNDFQGGAFTGEETKILELADLLSGAQTVRSVSFAANLQRVSVVPVQALSDSATLYFVHNRGSNRGLGLVSVTGTPAGNDVARTDRVLSIAPTAQPPDGPQKGASLLLDAGDTRFLSAAWSSGRLWVTGNDGCTPQGDSQLRSCARVVEIATETNSVARDLDIAIVQSSVLYPSVTVDAGGNALIAFTATSVETFPSVMVAGVRAGGGAVAAPLLVRSGSGPYTQPRPGSVTVGRWGDYSGAARDPAQPNVVWLASQHVASPSDGRDWGTAVAKVSFAPTASARRIAGADRFATAAAVAAELGNPTDVILATGADFPDAVAAAGLGGLKGAPILLTARDSLPDATASALSAIAPKPTVHVIGGPGAIGQAVRDRLASEGFPLQPYQGADRFGTAAAIAGAFTPETVGKLDGKRTALIATGLDFPDALAVGPFAYAGKFPILLVQRSSVPDATEQMIAQLGIEKVVIAGGPGVVDGTVQARLETLTGSTATRHGGADRFATATLVADAARTSLSFPTASVLVALGANFPDALAAGPLGGQTRAPVVLLQTASVPAATGAWLSANAASIAELVAIGGTAAISNATLEQARAAA